MQMKNNLFLLLLLITLSACNVTIKNTQFPDEFKCFEIEVFRFFVKYTQPVEGYTLKAMWFPKRESDTYAILNLNNGENEYNIRVSNNILMESNILELNKYKDIEDIPNEEVIILDKIPPIHFYDVDFDGKKELLIANAGGWNNGIFYEAYKIHSNLLEKMTEYPFTELCPNTKFDTVNKTFTNTFSWGESRYTYIYKQKEYQYMNIEYDNYTTHIIELDSAFIEKGDATPVRVHSAYKRKGNKMELVEREIVNYDKDYDISGNHLTGVFTDTIIIENSNNSGN